MKYHVSIKINMNKNLFQIKKKGFTNNTIIKLMKEFIEENEKNIIESKIQELEQTKGIYNDIKVCANAYICRYESDDKDNHQYIPGNNENKTSNYKFKNIKITSRSDDYDLDEINEFLKTF